LSNEAMPEAVARVARFLSEARAEARLQEFRSGTPTADAAAEAVGCELDQIVKSLVFDCDGRSILVLVPGDRRADRAKIAAAAGCSKARIAGADQVREATGYEPGAVAPFPLRQVETVFLDRSLLGHPLVWIGAGSERHMAALAPTELMRLSKAAPMDAVEARPEGPVREADQGRGPEREPGGSP
jgi:prolyl-tRNA editing enzyme YbaK/EbsC (Cys-tRNA(Pro) deacylase)